MITPRIEPRYFVIIINTDGDLIEVKEFKTPSQLNSFHSMLREVICLRFKLDQNGLSELDA